MQNTKKNLRIATIVLFSIALALITVGTIMMFLDDYRGNPCPETGIMPLFGLLLTVVGFILFYIGNKKPSTMIGTIVLLICAEPLIACSVLLSENYLAFIGYLLCICGMGLCFVALILTIVLLCISSREKKKSQVDSSVIMDNYYDMLKKIKELYDSGVLTEQEYIQEKDKVLKKIN